MKNKNLFISLLFLIVIIATVYTYWYFLRPMPATNIMVSDCKIAETSCTASLGEGKSLTLNIVPKPIPQTKVLTMDVFLKGLRANEVKIIFQGIEIDHNLAPYFLNEIEENHFNAQGFISLCSLSKMNWLANVVIFSGNQSWKISFPFETNR